MLVVIAGLLALAVWLWVGNQGGFVAASPGKVAANVWLILHALPTLAAIWLAAAGWGYPVRRWLFGDAGDRWVIQVAVGLALVLMGQYVLGIAGLLGAGTAFALLGVGLALLVCQVVTFTRQQGAGRDLAEAGWRWRLPWSAALMMPGVGLMLVAAACPPGTRWRVEAYGYDVLSYHLQLPREWLARGQITGLDHNVYSFLPDLMESAYAGIGAVHGSMLDAIYACQFFHVSLSLFTAIVIATIVNRFVGLLAAGASAAVFLSLPWTLITGSMAYTEMGMLAFAAAALLVMTDWRSERFGPAAVVGLLLGAATLCKLTAGPMLAAPLGLLMLLRLSPALRWRQPPSLSRAGLAFAVASLTGIITLSPYLIRNAVDTGNPVFPFASALFGHGGWTEALIHRWQMAHGLTGPTDGASPWGSLTSWSDLARQWPYNTGYGAVGGQQTHFGTTDIAHFRYEGGFPLLGVAVLLGSAAAVRRGITRRLAGALGVVMVVQVGFWFLATQHPSRYLIPTLLPGCLLIGLGLGRLSDRARWLRVAGSITCLLLPLVLVTISLGVLWRQSRPIQIRGQDAPWALVDSLNRPGTPGPIGRHPINALPPNTKTLVVGDNTALLYLHRPFDYASAFDSGLMSQLLRNVKQDAGDEENQTSKRVTAALRQRGYTHLWIGWSELERIEASFGIPGPATPQRLRRLTGDWPTVEETDHATLFKVPAP